MAIATESKSKKMDLLSGYDVCCLPWKKNELRVAIQNYDAFYFYQRNNLNCCCFARYFQSNQTSKRHKLVAILVYAFDFSRSNLQSSDSFFVSQGKLIWSNEDERKHISEFLSTIVGIEKRAVCGRRLLLSFGTLATEEPSAILAPLDQGLLTRLKAESNHG